MTETEKFKRFKAECLRLQKEWGLMGWHLAFRLEKGEDGAAAGMVVRDLNKRQIDVYMYCGQPAKDIKGMAKHEMCHVFFARLEELGRCRYLDDMELYEESENLAYKLENLL